MRKSYTSCLVRTFLGTLKCDSLATENHLSDPQFSPISKKMQLQFLQRLWGLRKKKSRLGGTKKCTNNFTNLQRYKTRQAPKSLKKCGFSPTPLKNMTVKIGSWNPKGKNGWVHFQVNQKKLPPGYLRIWGAPPWGKPNLPNLTWGKTPQPPTKIPMGIF